MTDHHSTPRPNRNRRPRNNESPSQRANGAGFISDGGPSKHVRADSFPIADNSYSPSPTPAKQAYAGPTFHASPAASALPMPRKFSKNVSASPLKSDSFPQSNENIRPASESPGPAHPAREASPLDIFFSAQRAENARKGSNSSPLTRPPVNAPDSIYPPPSQSRHSHQRERVSNGTPSNRDLFMQEVDGRSGDDSDENEKGNIKPSFPFQDRLLASQRMASPYSDHTARHTIIDEEEQARLDKSAALKKLLMGDKFGSSSNQDQHLGLSQGQFPQAPGQHVDQRHPQSLRSGNSGMNHGHNEFGNSWAPEPRSNGHPSQEFSDTADLEDSLRKILKLG